MHKRILITGATGVIGNAVAERLRTAGAEVTGISLSTGHDLRDPETLENISGPFDCLIHCAASFGGDAQSEAENELTNVRGTSNAVSLAARTGCSHFIYVSSIFAIDNEANGYFSTSYSQTKRKGEAAAKTACGEHGLKLAILRLPPIYDAAGRSRPKRKFLFDIIDAALSGTPLKVSASDAPRNFVLDEDAAEIIARVAERRMEGEFDISHPDSHTAEEIATFAAKAAGLDVRLVRDPDMPAPPPMFIPNGSSLFDKIGFRPRVSLKDGIAMIMKHIKTKENR